MHHVLCEALTFLILPEAPCSGKAATAVVQLDISKESALLRNINYHHDSGHTKVTGYDIIVWFVIFIVYDAE